MNTVIKEAFAKILRETADKIDAGSCELTESEAMDILKVIAHESLSKEQACIFLNMSRSKFDTKIAEGIIPKGRKRVGSRQLIWFKDELDKVKNKE